ncbi:hypothetical protein ACRBEV_22640 [Methylobacterium phyllosphaerae]
MFTYQYHVAVESMKSDYWITEKVLDCFRMKVVPIYWGGNKIGDFFDDRGVLFVEGIDEIIYVCNQLNAKYYDKVRKYVENNFRTSKLYEGFGYRIAGAIETHLHSQCKNQVQHKAQLFTSNCSSADPGLNIFGIKSSATAKRKRARQIRP